MKELAMKERMPSRGEKRMMTTNVIHLEKPPLPHAIIKKLSCRLTQAYMVPPQSYWYCSTLPLSPTPLGKFKNKNFEATPDPLTTLLLLTKPQNDPAHLSTQACTARPGLEQMVKIQVSENDWPRAAAPGGPPEGRDNLRTLYVFGEWKRGEGRREHIRQSD